MATLYRAETTLQEILGMKVGDELKLAGGDLPDYTEDDAGKALQVNQSGTGLKWGPGVPSYTSADVGKVLTVGEIESGGETIVFIPEQSVTTAGSMIMSGDIVGTPADTIPAKIDVTVDGATYNNIEYDPALNGYAWDGGQIVYDGVSSWSLVKRPAGTYTLSATGYVPNITPTVKWSTDSNPVVVSIVDAEFDSETGEYVGTASIAYNDLVSYNEKGVPIMLDIHTPLQLVHIFVPCIFGGQVFTAHAMCDMEYYSEDNILVFDYVTASISRMDSEVRFKTDHLQVTVTIQ